MSVAVAVHLFSECSLCIPQYYECTDNAIHKAIYIGCVPSPCFRPNQYVARSFQNEIFYHCRILLAITTHNEHAASPTKDLLAQLKTHQAQASNTQRLARLPQIPEDPNENDNDYDNDNDEHQNQD